LLRPVYKRGPNCPHSQPLSLAQHPTFLHWSRDRGVRTHLTDACRTAVQHTCIWQHGLELNHSRGNLQQQQQQQHSTGSSRKDIGGSAQTVVSPPLPGPAVSTSEVHTPTLDRPVTSRAGAFWLRRLSFHLCALCLLARCFLCSLFFALCHSSNTNTPSTPCWNEQPHETPPPAPLEKPPPLYVAATQAIRRWGAGGGDDRP
jgi:hypothetical protein